jgi:aminoglycoside phosphotransferase (APT) family kinase protein
MCSAHAKKDVHQQMIPSTGDSARELRSADSAVPQDWARLSDYLASQGMHLPSDNEPLQFSGGLANLNYLLRLDGADVVLRRPPPGILPPGAGDMGREFAILHGSNKGYG